MSLIVAAGLVAAACAPIPDAPEGVAEDAPGVEGGESGRTPDVPTFEPLAVIDADNPVRARSEGCEQGEFYWDDRGCEPATLVDLDEIISGGPPPDGIPPIDDPAYESIADAAEWLDDTSPVMVVEVDGDVRAYPLAILTWHEIVNDTIGGVPLTVTYCPLCNSALVFDRTVETDDGEMILDFGTSGRLLRSNLVMYDRQTRNLWTQFEGLAIVGEPFLGTQLTRLPAWLLGFSEFAALHPDAVVLSRDTGYGRDYGRNPYVGYDTPTSRPFLFRGDLDRRLPPMTRLVGIAEGDSAVAVLLDELREARVVEVTVGDDDVAVLWAPGQASALDTPRIDDGRDVGQTAAFVAAVDGASVQLAPDDVDGRFVDTRSGSRFDLRGRAIDGPLQGARLDPVVHDDSMWFVWVAFRPDTDVVGDVS